MQSCLFLESADRSAALALLRRLRALPGLGTLSNLRLVDCLTVDAAYPAETMAPLLTGLGGQIALELELTDDARCVPLETTADEDTAILLRAAGIDAAVTRQPIAILRGLDDWQYRHVRDALTAPTEPETAAPRRLPDDAFIGFTRTPLEGLCAQAKAMGLALPEGCLAVIADHYRAERRDPWPEELLILNEAFRQALADPSVGAPVEFVTNDARLHAAYADWMEKRRVLAPEADAPATLGELTTVATRYLCAHNGKAVPGARIASTPLTLAASGGAACGGFADLAGETALYLAAKPFSAASPQVDDRLVLILPGTSGDGPHFARALTQFFADPAVAGQIRRSLPVEPGRLIGALGQMLGGSGLGLLLTPPPEGASLMEQLSPAAFGALLACTPEAGKTVPGALRAQGLRFVLLATVQKKPVVELDRAPERLRFPAAMLAPRPALYAEIPAPDAPAPAAETESLPAMLAALASPAARRMTGLDPMSAPTLAQFPAAITVCGDTRLCAASVAPQEDPYGEVRDTALMLTARMAAAGVPLGEITLSLVAELPTGDRRAHGRAIAALLGLHTVQVELGLVAAPPTLRAGNALRVTLAATAPTAAAQPVPLAAGTSLWLLAPRSTAPHLDGERALFELAARERAAAPLIATGALTPAAAAARAALSAGLSLTLTAPAHVLNTPLPAGILLAAPALPALPNGVAAIELGATRPWSEQAVLCAESAVSVDQLLSALRGDLPAPMLAVNPVPAPPRISSRRYPRPRVLIPYAEDAPTALAGQVAALGGEPVLCAVDLTSAAAARQSISAYADLLDGAQILLLSGSRAFVSALLSQRRACDALANLRARDGLVCAWGQAFAALLGFGYFSTDGAPIPAAPLAGQRTLCSVITSTASPWADGMPVGCQETVLLAADPICPALSPDARLALAERGHVIACAAGTPDGSPAITALASADGALLGLVYPPTPALLSRGIAYFA